MVAWIYFCKGLIMLESYLQSNLTSSLNSGLSFKSEVKSVYTVQVGAKYGFVLEIDSPMGKYYLPVEGYRTKEQALQVVRGMIRR